MAVNPEVARVAAENRPVCHDCKPDYIDLGTMMCGCVTIAYLHQCRDEVNEVRVLCKRCAKELRGNS